MIQRMSPSGHAALLLAAAALAAISCSPDRKSGLDAPVKIDFKKRVIDSSVATIHYSGRELFRVIPGNVVPSIPTFRAYVGPPGSSRVRDKSMYCWRFTDDGETVLMTFGPTRAHRRIYKFDSSGKLVVSANHELSGANSIDVDEDGNFIAFIGVGLAVRTVDNGIVDWRDGVAENILNPEKPCVVRLNRSGAELTRESVKRNSGDFANGISMSGRYGPLPMYYGGNFWLGPEDCVISSRRHRLRTGMRPNPPELMAYAARCNLHGRQFILGNAREVNQSDRRVNVNTYEIGMGPDEGLGEAILLGGNARDGVFVYVSIQGQEESSVGKSSRNIFRINRQGECVERIVLDDEGFKDVSILYIDAVGEIFGARSRYGFDVVKWQKRS